MLYDNENKQQTPLFYESSRSEYLLQYMVDEIYYRTLELIAVRHFDEAREALGYKGDTDGRVYEMYWRVKKKSMDQWLPDMPGVLKNKDQLAIADEISLTISHYALFLFFGAMQKMHVPGILELLLDSLGERPLVREVERIFPEKGYTALGISDASLFAEAYERLLQQTSRTSSDPQYPYTPNLWIINPQPHNIDREHINFYKLTTDTNLLRTCLERCLKRNGGKYTEKALQQWRAGEAVYADRCMEPAQDDERKQETEGETRRLRDKLRQVEAEAEVLRQEVKERNGEIQRLKREMKAPKEVCVQAVKEEKEHARSLQPQMATQKKQPDVITAEKDNQIAKLTNELKAKEDELTGIRKEQDNRKESWQKELKSLKEREQLLKDKIKLQRQEHKLMKQKHQSMEEVCRRMKEENRLLKEKADLVSKQALPDTDSELLDRITSSLRRYENDLYDKKMVEDWTQIEMWLMHIFHDVPEMMETIDQIRNDRSRLVKEQKKIKQKKKKYGSPTVIINENNGPILTDRTDPASHTDKKLLIPKDE